MCLSVSFGVRREKEGGRRGFELTPPTDLAYRSATVHLNFCLYFTGLSAQSFPHHGFCTHFVALIFMLLLGALP